MMDALVTVAGNTAAVAQVPIPHAGPNEIRVKVHSIALNPVDALYSAHQVDKPGRVVGSDIAGYVDQIGEGVSNWEVGDRVAGLLQGATSANPRPGGFATYAILESDLAIAIPEDVSFDDAASLPLCALTAAQALYIRLGLNPPFPGSPYSKPPVQAHSDGSAPVILVYSAATSLGLYTVQLAKLLRYQSPEGEEKTITVITTSSPKHFGKLQGLGADAVFDYRDSSWPEQVRKAYPDGIDYAVDCISEGDTTGVMSDLYRTGGGVIAVIRAVAWNKERVRSDVTPLYGAVWSGLGYDIIYNGATLRAPPSSRALTVAFYQWLSHGSPTNPKVFPIDPNPVRLMPGGLKEVAADGFVLLGGGDMAQRAALRGGEDVPLHMRPISGEKLVYRV
ncbi:chaperonin 10-like protein [Ephemerocybe angulata]|uniref:Chaperonin 10-like protein n=1 Tax=Ephemerocybe angulata TaxID=980116 RepID=A0A8H6MGH3_9AGAR|nr:chaperonin 10-like protein [Tulosesus angulatus]